MVNVPTMEDLVAMEEALNTQIAAIHTQIVDLQTQINNIPIPAETPQNVKDAIVTLADYVKAEMQPTP